MPQLQRVCASPVGQPCPLVVCRSVTSVPSFGSHRRAPSPVGSLRGVVSSDGAPRWGCVGGGHVAGIAQAAATLAWVEVRLRESCFSGRPQGADRCKKSHRDHRSRLKGGSAAFEDERAVRSGPRAGAFRGRERGMEEALQRSQGAVVPSVRGRRRGRRRENSSRPVRVER